MRIEEKFNVRMAHIVEVQSPQVRTGPAYSALGIKATFFRKPADSDRSTLSMHMTPDEALAFAEQLIAAARKGMNE